MKRVILNFPPVLEKAGLSAKLLLQVHDELVLECPKKEVKDAARVVRVVIESAFKLAVPLDLEVRAGAKQDEIKGHDE